MPVPPAELTGDGPERPMDEDADRALGPPEDAGDLRGAQLIHEAQDDRAATIPRQPPHRAPSGGCLVPADRIALHVEGIRDDGLGRLVQHGGRMATGGAPFVGDDR